MQGRICRGKGGLSPNGWEQSIFPQIFLTFFSIVPQFLLNFSSLFPHFFFNFYINPPTLHQKYHPDVMCDLINEYNFLQHLLRIIIIIINCSRPFKHFPIGERMRDFEVSFEGDDHQATDRCILGHCRDTVTRETDAEESGPGGADRIRGTAGAQVDEVGED